MLTETRLLHIMAERLTDHKVEEILVVEPDEEYEPVDYVTSGMTIKIANVITLEGSWPSRPDGHVFTRE